ncbi:MAG: Error-prone repair protein ImuA [Niabella sp.]|nr:Error-prone repair protein ImuA [Niabella sp.]
MGQLRFHKTVFEQLQNEILQLQGLRAPLEAERVSVGLDSLQEAFPDGAFPLSAVHEFISCTKETAAATTGFMAGLLAPLMHRGCCLWISTRPHPYPPALKLFGVEPDQVIFVTARKATEALWAIEEGLKCATLAAVVGEVPELSFTASRRLQLAVEQSHVTGLIHRCTAQPPGIVACTARWRITPLASSAMEDLPGVGFARWQVELLKIRNGKPGIWQVQWTPQGFAVTLPEKKAPLSAIQKTG